MVASRLQVNTRAKNFSFLCPMKTYGLFTLFILALLCSCESEIKGDGRLTRVKTLNYYPSGSALEFINGRLYLMGDDARYVLVLNDDLEGVDSLVLFPGTRSEEHTSELQ